jgi:hypothetical protein
MRGLITLWIGRFVQRRMRGLNLNHLVEQGPC